MKNQNNTLSFGYGKDKNFQTQMKIVFESFKQPKTMLMVEIETGIMRSNVTWYVDELRRTNRIEEVRKGTCKVSNYSNVGFYTTDPNLFVSISTNQLNLFD